ncbi:MAG: hypothetical protein LC749_21740 [Actinobacteria bacterium]|nr:hypothetical protein [Actinomycetota bacterium]
MAGTSRAEYAERIADPTRRSCSAHGADACANEAVWMLRGKGRDVSRCQAFLDEHPEIPRPE